MQDVANPVRLPAFILYEEYSFLPRLNVFYMTGSTDLHHPSPAPYTVMLQT
jgi:hypothetical protein